MKNLEILSLGDNGEQKRQTHGCGCILFSDAKKGGLPIVRTSRQKHYFGVSCAHIAKKGTEVHDEDKKTDTVFACILCSRPSREGCP